LFVTRTLFSILTEMDARACVRLVVRLHVREALLFA
jgi:hypothetical protein